MRRLFFSCIATVALLPAFAQKKASITGKVPAALNNQKVYLYEGSGSFSKILDSAQITNGAFLLNYSITDTTQGMVSVRVLENNKAKSGYRIVVLTPSDKMKLTVNKAGEFNLFQNSTVSGSKLTAQFDALQKILKPINQQGDSIRKSIQKMMNKSEITDTTGYFALYSRYNELMQEQKELTNKFMLEHTDYYVSLMILREGMGRRVMDVPGTQAIFDKFPAAIRQSSLGQEAAELLKASALLGINQVAPDFSAATPEGQTMKLSDLRGKYVLLDFWASWCGPCRAENPHVVKAYQRFHDKNFDILGVSLDKPGAADKWTEAIQKDGLTWHHVSDLKFWSSDIAKLYMINSIPQNFLLNPDGKIIAVNLRGNALEEMLEKVIH
ncbi:DUF4369 domain-containing protein [Chitinophaga silvatica]|uniref:DUF4369 domain-containing protein n=1 Tax=Chitinophaga silvatica TaxID=2282649 RepID=A0A3E1Y4Q9_9BACT|nr:AhpC/TSA family protein [Chitinophaga silvatica]RFS19685.1 DUF4369 domain-containing protein [Chitinophaga silvatica]